MPSGDVVATPSQVREIWLVELRSLLEETTVQAMRQAAREWGWTLKGTLKSDLVEQMVGYLGDAARMAAAIKTLPEEEVAVLSWLAALGAGNSTSQELKAALFEGSGTRLSQKAINGHLQDLAGRCLIFYSEYHGLRMPDLYREWLPRPATPKLLYPNPLQLRTPSPVMTVAAITQHAQHLLGALTAEQPPAALAAKTAPSYRPGKPDPIDPLQPSLVTADILARWGYVTETEQQLARFLLEQMIAARLCRVSPQPGGGTLRPLDMPGVAWEMSTAMERLQRLRRAYLTPSREDDSRLPSWSEWDMAFPQMQGVSLQPTGYWVTTAQLMQQAKWAGAWLSRLVTSLEADTWYSVEQLCKLIYHVLRDLLIPATQQSWWFWVIDGQSLDPMQINFDRWMKTTGRMIEAWLTGPASWLLIVQIGTAEGRPAAFRRPGVLPAGVAEPPPPDSLRFMPDSVIGLTNDWRASDLRRLLRLISVEAARDATTTLLRLDTDAFRHTLRAGQDAVAVAATFAAAGFPLPPTVQETLQTWQSRAGRYQLYDQMTVVEFGEDVLPEELRAISRLSSADYYQPGPRCLIFPDPQVAPALVEELRRRGYTPQVLP